MYPAGVTGNESYFNPDTTAECRCCGAEFDTERAHFDNGLCNTCGDKYEQERAELDERFNMEATE